MSATRDAAATPHAGDGRWILALVALKLAVQALGIPGYGYFRDELYYLECTRHLSWGYVDQPPLSIAVLWAWRHVFGDSLWALRALPALAGAGVVAIVAGLAREMGGGRYAMGLAALAVIASPVELGTQQFFSMNAIEILLWALAAWQALRALRSRATRDWAWLGVWVGLGLLNKLSMSWFASGFALGLLVTPSRRALATPGPWLAVAIAGLLVAPHVAWQVAHHWPTLEFMRRAEHLKMVPVSALDFALGQLKSMNPLTAPLWIVGLVALLVARGEPARRAFGVLFLAVAGLLLAQGTSRANYLTPAYPMLLAAGAVAFERAFAKRRAWRVATPALIALMGALLLPAALPVLPEPVMVRYLRALGLSGRQDERLAPAALGQHYADMHGWPAFADTVAAVVARLTPEARRHCVVFAQNYGDASAVNFFGRARGLPHCFSSHNSYWIWGPPKEEPEVIIVLGGDADDNARVFDHIEIVTHVRTTWTMPYEQDVPVSIGRGLRVPLATLWPQLKNFI
ncbi:MAG TPA: glycosyltransferase family 39 protein [Candidatus Saccharimonadaceae bacterium]|nr:glycosyltransferase family 39 protein [Candidatus Saccharimonadaceae bacterium]